MRLVQVTVPAGKREAVLDELDDEGVDYVVSEETSGREFTALVSFPVSTNAVEPVLDRLHDVGIDEEAYTVVLAAETVVSRRFDRLTEEYSQNRSEDRIAREELRAEAADLALETRTYVIMTVVSAVVAAAGLLLDSPATVVGSMVIAPLIGPAMSASVGTVIDDHDLSTRGVKLQIVGIVLSIAAAAVFAAFVRVTNLVPPGIDPTGSGEVAERVAPDFLSLAVALGAGVAGPVSLSAGVSAAIVGVMIAVALIPPAATVGIGLAWGLPNVALGAAVLTLVNLLSINFVALLTFWYSGYRPDNWFQTDAARSALLKRAGVLAIAILVLSAFLGGVTYTSYQGATFEENAEAEIEALLANNATYQDHELLSLSVSDGEVPFLPSEVTTVSVTIARTSDARTSDLADTIRRRLAAETRRSPTVQLRFVETSGPGNRSSASLDAVESATVLAAPTAITRLDRACAPPKGRRSRC